MSTLSLACREPGRFSMDSGANPGPIGSKKTSLQRRVEAIVELHTLPGVTDLPFNLPAKTPQELHQMALKAFALGAFPPRSPRGDGGEPSAQESQVQPRAPGHLSRSLRRPGT